MITEVLKAKQESEQHTQTGFAKPILGNQDINTSKNIAIATEIKSTEPPKIITLGVFGNARKRPRPEDSSTSITPNKNIESSSCLIKLNSTDNNTSDPAPSDQKENNLSTITKIDELGHPEKIMKI